MILFVVVVIFVVVPFAFAGDVAWEIANPQEQLLWHHPPSTKQKTEPQQETSKTQNLPSTPPPPPIAQDNLTSDQKKEPTENQPKQVNNFWWKRENFWPPSFADWAQVVGAAVVAYIGLRTLKQIEKQIRVAALGVKVSRRAAKASEISATAALKSADAAMKSANVAEIAMKVGQRAYLVAGQALVKHIEGKRGVEAACPFANTGHTPAILTASHVFCQMEKELPPPPDYSQLVPTWEGKKLVSMGGITFLSADGPHVGTAEIREMKDSPMRLYFYGRVTYDDVFGGHWTTTFFTYYDRENKVMLPIQREGYNYTT